jgi:hypothetical protein
MRRRFIIAAVVVSFVFTTVLLAATLRDKRVLEKERRVLILKNDSLHVLQLEAKQNLTRLSKFVDSVENKSTARRKKQE